MVKGVEKENKLKEMLYQEKDSPNNINFKNDE